MAGSRNCASQKTLRVTPAIAASPCRRRHTRDLELKSAGFNNDCVWKYLRPGLYRLALASLGRELKMLLPSKEHHLCCDADTSLGYFPSPPKRPELELRYSKISTSISCGADQTALCSEKDNKHCIGEAEMGTVDPKVARP